MAPVDLKRIAAEVSAQHGIRIDADDPIMAVVTLNRLIFEQSVNELTECLRLRTDEMEKAAARVQVRAGGVLAQEVRECVAALKLSAVKGELPVRTPRFEREPWASHLLRIVIGLIAAIALLAAGAWAGTRLK